MPVRKIPKNYRNVTGILAASKATGAARFESTLERDFLTLLDFNPAVERFEVQPVKLPWGSGQASADHSYTPDVLVYFDSKEGQTRCPWLCEVKYRSELRKQLTALRPKFKAAVAYAAAKGWRFKLVTELEIRTPYLDNAKFLNRYIRFDQGAPCIRDEDLTLLHQTLSQLRETDPESLIQATRKDRWNQAKILPTLWHMIGTFQISADLHVPLTMKSRIWLPTAS